MSELRQNVILEAKGVCKSFSNVPVLKDIHFSVAKGEVRAVVGANGAGKSTLMKILGGVYKPTSGGIVLKGKTVAFHSPSQALESGISVIYQELSLVRTMTVFENVFLNREITKGALVDKKAMLLEYAKLAEELRFDIPGDVKVSKLGIANQQMIEIMKAISMDADIIIMDEPTTSLTDSEKNALYGIIRQLKEKGKTIIYISHILREIFLVADNITVMRDGEIVGDYGVNEITQMEVAGIVANQTAGVGQTRHAGQPRVMNTSEKPVVLEVNHLTKKGLLDDVSFKLRKGEVLGLAGLVGAGRTELSKALFGDMAVDSGEIILENKPRRFRLPTDAIKAGIGLIPEDRKNHGLILKHPVYKNATIICLKDMRNGKVISRRKQLKYMHDAVDKLQIKMANVANQAKTLSGGNQQKVVVAKWLGVELKVLIFDEPTKGIDVGAKEDIFKVVEDFAARGLGVIFISSDLEEVLRVSDRMLVMSRGRIVKQLDREDFDLQKIMALCMSISESEGAHE